MNNYDLDLLKKKYGERFAKLCRNLFPSLLEKEGLLWGIVSENFAETKFLYEDIKAADAEVEFKKYLYSFMETKQRETVAVQKPTALMKLAGYSLQKCETNKDIQFFKKYYKQKEELCTFNDNERINTHLVFFAVKDNVEKIKRENFSKPLRQDEYGTSVISIQFSKSTPSTLSIKNRYNHTVSNPDATFSNDLENIYAGLTESFVKEYGIDLVNKSNSFELPGYVLAQDGKLYKHNCEINNIYYCPNNIVINQNRQPIHYDKDKFLVFDQFLLDFENKKLSYLPKIIRADSFVNEFNDIKKIKVNNSAEGKVLIITPGTGIDIEITLDKTNKIIGYSNPNLTKMGDDFLSENYSLKELNLPNLTEVGNNCLYRNSELTKLDAQNLTKVGNSFLARNKKLAKFNAPSLSIVGDAFLARNTELSHFIAPNITEVGDEFLENNEELTSLDALNLTKVGDCFLERNKLITKLNVPQLTEVGNRFFCFNQCINELIAPSLVVVNFSFLYLNKALTELNLPSLSTAEFDFLYSNESLKNLSLPNLIEAGSEFLNSNAALTKLVLNKLKIAGNNFLKNNENLTELIVPELTQAGDDFLYWNQKLTQLNAPNLTKTDDNFLQCNKVLNKFTAPKLTQVGKMFLFRNKALTELDLPNLTRTGKNFLYSNKALTRLNAPKVISLGSNSFCKHFKKKKLLSNILLLKHDKTSNCFGS